jgi:hypothetical protein
MDDAAIVAVLLGIAVASAFVLLLFRATKAEPNQPKVAAPAQAESVIELAQRELEAARNVADAKLLLSEWKLERKSLKQRRTAISNDMRAIRATHTERVRNRMPMFPGGGGLGKFVRATQTVGRHNQRLQLAADLAPHETDLQGLDHAIALLDEVILMGERRLLEFKRQRSI